MTNTEATSRTRLIAAPERVKSPLSARRTVGNPSELLESPGETDEQAALR